MMCGDATLTPDRTDPPHGIGESGPVDFAPEPVRLINDLETLRAISDSTRIQILEAMVRRQEAAWSVKELAAALDVPQTRLYHHVDLLAAHDLIRATERRVVSGIIETRYRATATSFQLDRSLLAGGSDEQRELVHQALTAVFDTARSDIEEAIRVGVIDGSPDARGDNRLLLTHGLARLSPARAEDLRRRLRDLHTEFGDDDDPDGAPYGVVLAIYPMAPARETAR
jgi:DNA-binding transcriptional ArsR family regulator